MTLRSSLLFSLIAGLLAAGFLALTPAGFSLAAWGLLAVLVFVLTRIWIWAGGGRKLVAMLVAAFVLRLVMGIFLQVSLPVWGYDEPAPNAGYVFVDAWQRDSQAWELASSNRPLGQAFTEEFRTDQYGGLLALSAGLYRILSPVVHQPMLVVIFSAWTTTVGLAFFWRAVRMRWDERTAVWAGWIFALYPESIVLGASQMREPFIMGLTAIAFWAVLQWRENRRTAVLVGLVALAGLALISSRVAVPAAAVLAGWAALEYAPAPRTRLGCIGVSVLAFGLVAALGIYGYAWLSESAIWDAALTSRASGWIQWLADVINDRYRVPLVTVYGLTQPVLPGAMIEPSIPMSHFLGTFRGLGWYALVPVLLYSIFAAVRLPSSRTKWLMLYLVVLVWAWIVVASLRAGGDAWDNPRYRTHFMVWIALLAAWAIEHARVNRSPWLLRWFMVEGVFVLLLTAWYLGRYVEGFPTVPFGAMLVVDSLAAVVILLGGWLLDRRRASATGDQRTG